MTKEKYSFGSRLKNLSHMNSILHYAVHELVVLENLKNKTLFSIFILEMSLDTVHSFSKFI
ncbi:hypothetical protein [Salipaludibacillus neizhouensis]|uniref:hypothetical protein n=1 Tax=Salipaludibacillus neizhouensis TaxID=885475 RepID=UPI001C7DC03D|nr:hypothetical protein [Salipaludibacillus neizhouensis]